MRFTKLAAFFALFLCLFAAPAAQAATMDYNWKVMFGDEVFPTGYDTTHGEIIGGASSGGYHANTDCPTLHAGEVVFVIVALNGLDSNGDPGPITQTTGTTLTSLYDHDDSARVTKHTRIYYRKIAADGEACAWTFTWTKDLDQMDYAIVNFKPSSGTVGTVIDVAAADMDELNDPSGNMFASSISPVNTGDTLVMISTFAFGPAGPFTPATGMTQIMDSHADSGTWSAGSIFMAVQVGIGSGATGNKTNATFSGSFNNVDSALISLNAPSGGGGGGGPSPSGLGLYMNSIP